MKKLHHLALAVSLASLLFMTGCGGSNGEVSDEEAMGPVANTNEKKAASIIDLKQISGKALAEVEAVLGKAESTEKVKGYPCEQADCQRAFFKSEQYEIIFKSGTADRITINNVPDLTNNEDALQTLGLPVSKPGFKNAGTVIRWNNIENIHEISFFPMYVYVQVTAD